MKAHVPTIETIIEGLLSGEYTKQQAIGWLYQHVTAAAVDAGRCLRDEFAMAALTGLMTHTINITFFQEDAAYCYNFADAMIDQRSK